jgi:hypothetical protein
LGNYALAYEYLSRQLHEVGGRRIHLKRPAQGK